MSKQQLQPTNAHQQRQHTRAPIKQALQKRILPRRASEYSARVVIAEKRIRSTSIEGDVGRLTQNTSSPVTETELAPVFLESKRYIDSLEENTGFKAPYSEMEHEETDSENEEEQNLSTQSEGDTPTVEEVFSWFPIHDQEEEPPNQNFFVILEEFNNPSRNPLPELPNANHSFKAELEPAQPPKKSLTEEEYWRGFLPYLPQVAQQELQAIVLVIEENFLAEGGSDLTSNKAPTTMSSSHSLYTKRLFEFVAFVKVHELIMVRRINHSPILTILD